MRPPVTRNGARPSTRGKSYREAAFGRNVTLCVNIPGNGLIETQVWSQEASQQAALRSVAKDVEVRILPAFPDGAKFQLRPGREQRDKLYIELAWNHAPGSRYATEVPLVKSCVEWFVRYVKPRL